MKDFLADWAMRFVKQRDLMRNTIKSIDATKDGFEVTYEDKKTKGIIYPDISTCKLQNLNQDDSSW